MIIVQHSALGHMTKCCLSYPCLNPKRIPVFKPKTYQLVKRTLALTFTHIVKQNPSTLHRRLHTQGSMAVDAVYSFVFTYDDVKMLPTIRMTM